MPFRSNMFGDKIAQPDTEWTEIDNLLCDKGIAAASIYAADLSPFGEDDFKFGGTLYVSGSDFDDADDEPREFEINFDGFETMEAAREWVEGLDEVSFDINVIS